MKKNMNKKKLMTFGAIGLFSLMLITGALLTYYGQITQEVTVNQAILVDGLAWNEATFPLETEIGTSELEAITVLSDPHSISNIDENNVGIVKLSSVCSVVEGEDSCDEIVTTPIFDLTTIAGSYADPDTGNQVSYQDRVVAKSNIAVNDINTLNFDYMLTTTLNGYSPYFVLAFDTNTDGIVDQWAVSLQDNGVSTDEWNTHGNGLVYHNVGICTQTSLCNLETLKTQLVGANLLQVKVMFGYWGGYSDTATALVKNIKINDVDLVVANGLIVRQYDSADPEDNTWGDNIVDFSMESYFPQFTIPNTYTITTEVQPVTA